MFIFINQCSYRQSWIKDGDGITFWSKSFNDLNTKGEFNEDEVLQVEIEVHKQLLL